MHAYRASGRRAREGGAERGKGRGGEGGRAGGRAGGREGKEGARMERRGGGALGMCMKTRVSCARKERGRSVSTCCGRVRVRVG